jgi:hypothetical protein
MANPNPSPATRFSATNPGRAKQKGARDRLSTAFLTAFAEHFEQHGKSAIEKVYAEDATAYLRIAAMVLPKELDMQRSPLDDWTEEEMDKVIAYLREVVREPAGSK